MIRKKIVRKNGCFECFRLLNSEIGNDQIMEKLDIENLAAFSSP